MEITGIEPKCLYFAINQSKSGKTLYCYFEMALLRLKIGTVSHVIEYSLEDLGSNP